MGRTKAIALEVFFIFNMVSERKERESMTSLKHAGNLVWMDMEMSGLNPDTDVVLEAGVAVTDAELNILAEGPCLVVHQPDSVLEGMDPWCKEHHGKSGLTQEVRNSKITLAEAETKILQFIEEYCPPKASPLCGNTIWHDRRFLIKYMPKIDAYLHFRNIDVSTIKELVSRWYPKSPQSATPSTTKVKAHRVLSDIKESIQELTYYRSHIFK